jgi:plasmid maintenance system antidote protein VapI
MIQGKRNITARIAARIACDFGTWPDMWMRFQKAD